MKKPFKIIKWNKKEKPTLELLKEILKEKGLNPYIYNFSPDEYYSNHTHSNDEVRAIVKGKMLFGLPDYNKEVILEDGDILYIKANTTHNAKVLSNGVISLAASK